MVYTCLLLQGPEQDLRLDSTLIET